METGEAQLTENKGNQISFFKKINKKILIVFLVFVVLVVAFLIYYKYFAKGLLIVNASPSGYAIELDNKKFENIQKTKKIWLKPGTYVLTVEKEEYLEFQDVIYVGPLRINRQNIELKKMGILSLINNNGSGGTFMSFNKDGSAIIYLSPIDNNFYQVGFGEKTYTVGNANYNKININLGLAEKETVTHSIVDVKYSPSKNKALVFIQSVDDETNDYSQEVKQVIFDDSRVASLGKNINDVDWFSNDSIIGIDYQDGQYRLFSANFDGSNQQELTDLPDTSDGIYVLNENLILIDTSLSEENSFIFYDLRTQEKTPLVLKNKDSTIFDVKPSPANNYIAVLAAKDDKEAIYLVGSDKIIKETSAAMDLGLFCWSNDGKSIIYVDFDDKQEGYKFVRFYPEENKTEEIVSYSSNLIAEPTDLLATDKYLNFIAGESLINYQIK